MSHRLLAGALTVIQGQQQERDRKVLEERRLTRRERARLQDAVNDAWPPEAVEQKNPENTTSVVDALVADTLRALATRSA